MKERHLSRTLAALLLGGLLLACGGDDGGDSGAAGTPLAGESASTTTEEDPASEDATIPTDCADRATNAVLEALGGAPILDPDDSYYEEPLDELRCHWRTEDLSGDLVVQLSTASNYIGYYASHEATGGGDYTPVEGFDEGRRYDDGLLVATRNGFTVVVAAGIDTPAEQVDAIALEATASR